MIWAVIFGLLSSSDEIIFILFVGSMICFKIRMLREESEERGRRMKYRGIFEYEYPTEHKTPVSIDVHLHGDCVKGKIIEWEYRPLEQNPTTKNDLEVDWESYKDIDGNSLDDLILEVLQNNFDCGNTYGYKVADEIIGLLPSVTPQEPRKGHWIGHPHECGINWEYPMYECSECHEWAEDNSDFCPNCGADMREGEE